MIRKQMIEKEISIKAEKSAHWLASIKCNLPKRYAWLMSMDKDKYKSVMKCREYIRQMEEQIQNLWYEDATEYYKFLWSVGIFKNKQRMYSFTKQQVFAMNNPLSKRLKTIEQYEIITKAMNEQ